ncbi:MAG: flavin reductase family protein [Candidatus Eiseniibacteriota bacterium]
MSPRDVYRLMISVIVPRPIAWVSTLGADGVANLAPFSYYGGIGSEPPMLSVAIGSRRGEFKDTARNLRASGEFVVNVVSEALAGRMVATSADEPPGVDEFERYGLTPAPCDAVSASRVAEAPVAMECRVERLIELGRGPTTLAIGEIVRFHVRDALLSAGAVDPERLRPLARLGGDLYASLGALRAIARPRRPGPDTPGQPA